jgi:hypothetical protein
MHILWAIIGISYFVLICSGLTKSDPLPDAEKPSDVVVDYLIMDRV